MLFDFKVNDEPIFHYEDIVERIAIRGVIIHNHKILLVETSKGDLKFPGGGLEAGEIIEECLLREIKEETGYVNVECHQLLGKYFQRRYDTFNDSNVFQSSSYYYICQIRSFEKVDVNLDDYEQELQFQSKWVSIDEAIQQNLHAICHPHANGWIGRELVVLTQLKNCWETLVEKNQA